MGLGAIVHNFANLLKLLRSQVKYQSIQIDI